jgi:hypothetical protein
MLYDTEEAYVSAERTANSGRGKHEKNRSSPTTFAANLTWIDRTSKQAYVTEILGCTTPETPSDNFNCGKSDRPNNNVQKQFPAGCC